MLVSLICVDNLIACLGIKNHISSGVSPPHPLVVVGSVDTTILLMVFTSANRLLSSDSACKYMILFDSHSIFTGA